MELEVVKLQQSGAGSNNMTWSHVASRVTWHRGCCWCYCKWSV